LFLKLSDKLQEVNQHISCEDILIFISPPAKHPIETAKNATIPNAGTTTPFKGYIV